MPQIKQWEMTALSMLARAPKNQRLDTEFARRFRPKMSVPAQDIADVMITIDGVDYRPKNKALKNKSLKTGGVAVQIAHELMERGKAATRSRVGLGRR